MTTKYCSSCRRYQSPEHGQYIKNSYGKNVRWRCEPCKIRALLRDDKDDLDVTKYRDLPMPL